MLLRLLILLCALVALVGCGGDGLGINPNTGAYQGTVNGNNQTVDVSGTISPNGALDFEASGNTFIVHGSATWDPLGNSADGTFSGTYNGVAVTNGTVTYSNNGLTMGFDSGGNHYSVSMTRIS